MLPPSCLRWRVKHLLRAVTIELNVIGIGVGYGPRARGLDLMDTSIGPNFENWLDKVVNGGIAG